VGGSLDLITSVGVGLALRTHLLIWTAGGAALVACAAQLLLTPRWGPPGAAAATFLGYATSAVLTYRVAQRVHPLPYRGGRVFALMALGLGLAVAVSTWAPSGIAGFGWKLATLLLYVGVCGALQVVTDRGAVAVRGET
jgi:O-antigen/teichoic acid export membrane protein